MRYFDKVFGDRPKTARQEWLDELGKALSSPALATIVHAFDFIMDGVKPDKWDDWVQDDLEKGRDMERECQFEDLVSQTYLRMPRAVTAFDFFIKLSTDTQAIRSTQTSDRRSAKDKGARPT